MRFPKTLLEFHSQFPDEASCWAYLRRMRWPRGFVCPRCGKRGSHFIPTPRWSTYDAAKLGVEPPKDVPQTIQERAYSSPIWYTPVATAKK